MSQTNQCPECGADMPAGKMRGLCPACLLKRGLESNTVEATAGTAAPHTRWTPPPVGELAARFPELEIVRLIGRGGMGAVYEARQKNLDRVVAMKILPSEMGQDAAFAERFAREAHAMARLNHPHIVTIHEFGERSGWYFLLMEFVDGVSLRGLLDSGHVSPKEALTIVPQICEALQYAHDCGIVHRDIKPENILLNKQGQVKIADFGLAKLIGRAAPAMGGTNEKVMGTPQYMAPEQTSHPADVDHRADIYSLGVVFYQMLTGELPRGKFEPPSHKVVIDVRLDEVVLRAMEKEPERRYQQASEVQTVVETIASTEPDADVSQHAVSVGASFQFGEGHDAQYWQFRKSIPLGAPVPRSLCIGAIWFGLFALISPVIIIWREPIADRLSSAPYLISAPLFLALTMLLLPAPLVTTIIGAAEIGRIRRSEGRLRGMPLAIFNLLAFPLLAVDAFIVLICVKAARILVDFHASASIDADHGDLVTRMANQLMWHPVFALLPALGIIIVVDFLLIQIVRRDVMRRLAAADQPGARTPWKMAAIVVMFLLAMPFAVLAMLVQPLITIVSSTKYEPSAPAVVSQTIRSEVRRQLNEAGATFAQLDVSVDPQRDSAMMFGVNYSGLSHFTSADGTGYNNASGEFIMSYIGSGKWQGALGGTRFTVQARWMH